MSARSTALAGLRICDLSGQLAGAGATRTLAAFGAEVIRVEDPVEMGRWDILRGVFPFIDRRRGNEFGGAFNNHNVDKLGVTINMRTDRGKELLADLIAHSDVVTENFSAGVLGRWGFPYERMREIKPDIIYVSNCGFGQSGPYSAFRTWGPIVQAMCGLTFTAGLRDQPSAGWGFSYMDHHGANFMTLAILAALRHRNRTGEGQWVDMSCVEAGAAMVGPMMLDWAVNGRPARRAGMPDSNHNQHPAMAPHNIYPSAGDDQWVALSCRDDAEWRALAEVIAEPWCTDERWTTRDGRLRDMSELDELITGWTSVRPKFEVQLQLQAAGVPAAAVQTPPERIDHDAGTSEFGLWPIVEHAAMGPVRVDGLPVHLSDTDWVMERGAPLLGEHNRLVFRDILGLSDAEIDQMEHDRVV